MRTNKVYIVKNKVLVKVDFQKKKVLRISFIGALISVGTLIPIRDT